LKFHQPTEQHRSVKSTRGKETSSSKEALQKKTKFKKKEGRHSPGSDMVAGVGRLAKTRKRHENLTMPREGPPACNGKTRKREGRVNQQET